jgi:hypothetical protein
LPRERFIPHIPPFVSSIDSTETIQTEPVSEPKRFRPALRTSSQPTDPV